MSGNEQPVQVKFCPKRTLGTGKKKMHTSYCGMNATRWWWQMRSNLQGFSRHLGTSLVASRKAVAVALKNINVTVPKTLQNRDIPKVKPEECKPQRSYSRTQKHSAELRPHYSSMNHDSKHRENETDSCSRCSKKGDLNFWQMSKYSSYPCFRSAFVKSRGRS